MILDVVRNVRNPDIRRKIRLCAVLLAGGAALSACEFPVGPPTPPILTCNTSDCDPPAQGLHDPNFHAGATVSLRTPAAGDNGVTLFARTGVLAPVDNPSTAAAPIIPGITTGGTASMQENITVPLYGGVTVPAKNLGVPIANLSFEAFGGANIKNEKLGFAVDEATGGYAAASKTYWEANPAAGAGIQYYLGKVYGVPTSLGAAYIVDFQLANHTAMAASPTVLGQVYSFTDPRHVSQTAAVTLNFDLGTK